ncbi:MAG: histidine kinase N-terminal 7TM domain-containing protein [Acidobacteriota bacterium]
MSLSFTPYALPSLVAVFLCWMAASAIWPRRSAPGASVFLGLMASVMVWTACQAITLTLVDFRAKVLVSKFQYLGIASMPVLLLWFAARYSRSPRWFDGRAVLAHSIVPALTVAFVWTNERHGLVWAEIGVVGEDSLQAVVVKHGPWFRVFTLYTYLTIFISVLLILGRFKDTRHQRSQALIMASVPLAVSAFNVAYLLEIPPFETVDGTPIGFSVGLVLCGIALFRFGLFDLLPVAREALFDSIGDVVVVFDRQDRVADLNPAALDLLEARAESVIGAMAVDVFPHVFARALDQGSDAEILWPHEDGDRTYEMKLSEVRKEAGLPGGRLAILHDVSRRKRIQSELVRARDELRKTNEELERLVLKDPLTGLANRRSFFSRLDEEILRFRRFGSPVAMVMVDLDDFKAVNDAHGHLAGDRVLTAIARVLDQCRLNVDLAARLGGEEFALLLPGTRLRGASVLAERLRAGIAALEIGLPDGQELRVTASLGVVEIQSGMAGSDLMSKADKALYRAKESGKNQVCSAESQALVGH